MAKRISAFEQQGGNSVSRPGVHAKTQSSNHKKSKFYKKAYKGQGR